jgi:hypothetical protein
LAQVSSPGLAQNSSKCWYSCAKTASYLSGCAGLLSQRTVEGSFGGSGPVRCAQSKESITLRLTNALMPDEW